MPATDFVLEIEIRVPQARLHAFLCDLNNYVPLHPLIESIEEISPMDDRPRARRYRVVDRVRLCTACFSSLRLPASSISARCCSEGTSISRMIRTRSAARSRALRF